MWDIRVKHYYITFLRFWLVETLFLHQKTELHTWDQLVPSNTHKTDLMIDEYANREYHHSHIVDTKHDQR